MKNGLIILTDLGCLRAYKVRTNGHQNRHLNLVADMEMIDAHRKISETLTDQAGRFPGVNGQAMTMGENHNLQQEIQRRLIKQLGESINQLIEQENYPYWYFAAPQGMHQRLLDELVPEAKNKLLKGKKADLVKIDKMQLLQRFEL